MTLGEEGEVDVEKTLVVLFFNSVVSFLQVENSSGYSHRRGTEGKDRSVGGKLLKIFCFLSLWT